ncbi:MAG: hypothetical protein LBG43_08745, partial [Treponema sp.]|nr:hypothetical protein [Treponema sp.]
AERDDRDYSIEFTDELKGEGYDGVYYNGDLRKEWTVFKPNQAKSATGNAGTFSTDNDSILFQTAYHGGGNAGTHGRFSTDRIGEGEGGSKYGWGLYFGNRKATAAAYRKALENKSQGEGHEYAVNVPENEDLADWDRPLSEQPQKIKDKMAGLYRYEKKGGGFTVYLGGVELNTYDDETGAKTLVQARNREGQTFGSFYGQLTAALGSPKAASLFLKSIDIPGHTYLGEFATAGENQDVPNFVIYDDRVLGDPELLYQTEDGLVGDAINAGNAEDFKQYFRAMYSDEDVADIPGAANATDEWLEQFYEAAARKGRADDMASTTQRTLTREEANKEITAHLAMNENLHGFLQMIGNYIKGRDRDGGDPDMEEGMKRLHHGFWTSGGLRAAGGKELSPQMAKTLKTIIKEYPDDIRLAYGYMAGIPEFIDAAGQTPREKLLERARALGDGHYTRRIAAATNTELKRIAQEIGSAEIAADVENGTVTAGDRRIMDYTEVKKRETGKVKERIEKIEDDIYEFTKRTKRLYERDVKEYENAIKLQEQIIKAEKSLRESNFLETTGKGRTAQAQLAGERAKTQREYKDLIETYNNALKANKEFAKDAEKLMGLLRKKADAEHEMELARKDLAALEKVGAARNALLKNTMRKVNWSTVKVDRGEELIAFQRLMYSALKKDIAAFAGPEKKELFEVWTKYRTNADYRQEIKDTIQKIADPSSVYFKDAKRYDEMTLSRVRSLDALMAKDWESLTKADFNSLYRLLPNEVAEKELALWETEAERREKIQIDIAWFEGEDGYPAAMIEPELEDRIKQFVPGTVLARIKYKPVGEWTFNELLEAAIAADKIYHKGVEERQLDLATRREMTKKVQDELLDTIKTVAGRTGKEAEDILNKYAKGASGNGGKKEIFGFAWNHVSSRRFFKMMDNYTDGRFTELMHWMEDDAFNNEQRSMRARVEPVTELMKKLKIDPQKLTDYVIERDSYAGDSAKEKFSIENLLFMEAARQDDLSYEAMVYGNFLTNDEKIQMEGLAPEDKMPFMQKAHERFNSVMKEAGFMWVTADEKKNTFFGKEENKKYLELLKAVQKDYDTNFYKIDRLSRRLYNKPVWKVSHYVPLMRQGFGSAQIAAQVKELLGSRGLDTQIEKGMLAKRIIIGAEHQTPIDMRLYNGWLKSVEKTEHLLAYGETLQRWNDVFKGAGSNPLNTAVNNRYGKKAVDYIREYIGYTANPKAGRDEGKLNELIRTFRGRTAAAYLPFKVSGLVFQAVSSPFPYFTEMSPVKYLAAAFGMIADPGSYNKIREMSPYMRSRKFSPIQDLLKEMREADRGKIDRGAARLAEKGIALLEAVDTAAVFPGWLVKYNEVLAKYGESGKDINAIPEEIQKEAVREADDLVRRLQPSTRDLPPAFRSTNEGIKMLLQFQSPQAVILQELVIDAFMPGAPPELKKANRKHAARIFASFVICGVVTNLIRNGIPDDEEEGKAAAGYIAYGLSGLTDNLPVIGGAASDFVTGMATGKWSWTAGRSNPFPVIDTAMRTGKNISGGDYQKALESGLDTAMLFFGLPYSAKNEIKALFKDGEIHPEALLGQR